MSARSSLGGARQKLRRRVGHQLLLVAGTTMILTAMAPLHTAGLSWLERAAEFVAVTLVWELAMVAAARTPRAPAHHRRARPSQAGGRAERRGQSWRIVLACGLTVLVSKASVSAVRSAGHAARDD